MATKFKESYEKRFRWRLNRDYSDDETCRQIAANERLWSGCAVMLKSYLEPELTDRLYSERKALASTVQEKAQTAVDGLEMAADLFRFSQEHEKAAQCHLLASDLQAMNSNASELSDTKRHGRDRDIGILDSAIQVLEQHLGHPLSYETLANLLNAAQRELVDLDEEKMDEATGDASKEFTANSLRMLLERFRTRNPHWNTSQ